MSTNTIGKQDAGGGGTISATDAVQNDSLPRRDSNGDIYTNIFFAAKGLRTAGSLFLDYQTKSASFVPDLLGTNYGVTAAGSDITVTLPPASGVADQVYTFVKLDSTAGNIVIDGDSSETIDGKTTFTLYSIYDAVTVVSDGTNWKILNATLAPVVIAKSADFTAADQPFTEFIYIVTTGSAVTATLPAVSGLKGRKLTFKRMSASNNLVIDGSGSETIDGATTKTNAAQYTFYAIVCDGTTWHSVAINGTWT